jgi:ribosome maturation factor RimP
MPDPFDIDRDAEPSDDASTQPAVAHEADTVESGRAAVRLLEDVVGPVVATMGYALVHLEWASTARPRVVRLYIDREGGMTLDDCARLSPIIGNALDAAEHGEDAPAAALRGVLEAHYVLEVSSPGVERPLSRRSQFDLHKGARATVRTHAPLDPASPQKTFHGRIVDTAPATDSDDDREGRVSLVAEDGAVHEIPLSLIRRANLVYEPPQAPQARAKPGTRVPGGGRSASQKAVNRG